MNQAALTFAQIEKLQHGIARSRDITFRLLERISAQSFPDADSIKVASARAREAVEDLYPVAAELEQCGKAAEVDGGQIPQQAKPRSRRARPG